MKGGTCSSPPLPPGAPLFLYPLIMSLCIPLGDKTTGLGFDLARGAGVHCFYDMADTLLRSGAWGGGPINICGMQSGVKGIKEGAR